MRIYGCNGRAKSPDPNAARYFCNGYQGLSAMEMRHLRTAITEFVDSTFSRGHFNGCLLVAKNGEIIYEKYAGFRNPKLSKDSVTATTPFHLASVSKTFTAMAIMKLQEESKLKIDDSVSLYLPSFPLKGVTIKSLLNHRSGIPNYVHYMENLGWSRKKQMTNKDVLDFIIANHSKIQIGPPNRRFSYSIIQTMLFLR